MTTQIDPTFWSAMPWRNIGPARGGRVIAVAGDPNDIATFYFGAVAGGVWKTTDAGVTWRNVSDGFFKTASVSDLCVSPSDPNVIYAGMGESTIRTDVTHGDGVYKSTDAGNTWQHCGLADTRHIGKVRVHPRNPDRVFVAALGHAFGPNEERGVFRSLDGGKSWEKILYVSEKAGAVDLSIDPQNPEILYASFWETHRHFWELSSGGPGSGLWKSIDGGDTWTDISRAKGLPKEGLLGKIGVSASPAQAGRVWTAALAGSVDVDAVDEAAHGLASAGLAWDGARLAGHGASRTTDRRVAARLLACARDLHPIEGLRRHARNSDDSDERPAGADGSASVALSERETDVARLVLQGKTYAEIGRLIFISPRTVEHHVAHIKRRLGATSRSDLLAKLRVVVDESSGQDADTTGLTEGAP